MISRSYRKMFINYGKFEYVEDDPNELLAACVANKGSDFFYGFREKLILRYLPLSLSIAAGYVNSRSRLNNISDIKSVATYALVGAVDFLIEKGEHPNIGAYVHVRVNGDLLNWIARSKKHEKRNVICDDPDHELEYDPETRYNILEDKIIVEDLIESVKHGRKRLNGIEKIVPCSDLIRKRYEGFSMEEIAEHIFSETGRKYTRSRIDQMLKRVYDSVRQSYIQESKSC